MGVPTAIELLTNSHVFDYILTFLKAIRKFNDVLTEILPGMGKDTFFIVMFPYYRTEFSFEFKKHEIVIKDHKIKQFNLYMIN